MTGNADGFDGTAAHLLCGLGDDGETVVQHVGRVQFRRAVIRQVEGIGAVGAGERQSVRIEHDGLAAARADVDAKEIHRLLTTLQVVLQIAGKGFAHRGGHATGGETT